MHTSAHTHTHSYNCSLSRANPFHLTALGGRGYILLVTVALCCPPGDGAQPLHPVSLPRAGPHRTSCAVTFMSCKQRWKAEQSWTDTFHPVYCWTMFHLFASAERIRDNFVFICESNESTVSAVWSQTNLLCSLLFENYWQSADKAWTNSQLRPLFYWKMPADRSPWIWKHRKSPWSVVVVLFFSSCICIFLYFQMIQRTLFCMYFWFILLLFYSKFNFFYYLLLI